MDYESERTRKLGCWDGIAAGTGPINAWTTNDKTPDFEPDDDYCNFLCDSGFGQDCDSGLRQRWHKLIRSNYQGDEGRRRMRMCAINLRDRDGLHAHLFDVQCPLLWMHVSLPHPVCHCGPYWSCGERLWLMNEFRGRRMLSTVFPMRRRRLSCLSTRRTLS